MTVAVILLMIVLIVASGPVTAFVEAHPTVKVPALGFLMMIGMALGNSTRSSDCQPVMPRPRAASRNAGETFFMPS